MHTYRPKRRAQEHRFDLTSPAAHGRFGGKGVCGLALIAVWLLPWVVSAESLGPLYSRAHNAFKAQQWAKAARDFRRLLPLLQQRQRSLPPQSKKFHLLTLGQCDVLYHLAEALWRQQKPRRSCLLHQRLRRWLHGLPAGWRQWRVHPDVPRRIADSLSALKTRCPQVPSLVLLDVSPANAAIFLRRRQGSWRRLKSRSLKTFSKTVTLRLEAAGYRTQTFRGLPVKRWQRQRVTLALQKRRPPPRLASIRRPVPPRLPQPTPVARKFYQTWWFWTITGVVVVGGTATIAIVATQQTSRPAILKPAEGSTKGFPLF